MMLALTPLGETFTLAPEPNDTVSTARYPDVAAIGDGRFVVAYEEFDADRTTRIVAQRFEVGTGALTPAEEIGDGSPTTVRYARAPISVDLMSDGSYTVFWINDNLALGQRYAPDGTVINQSADLVEPVLEEDGDGNPVYVFIGRTTSTGYNSGGVTVSKYAFLPTPGFNPNPPADIFDPRDVLEFDIAAQEGGAFSLAYIYLGTDGGGYDLGVSTYGDPTDPVATDRELSDDLLSDAEAASRQQSVETDTLENGTRVVVWHDLALDGSAPQAVKALLLDAEGTPMGGVLDIAVSDAAVTVDPMPSVVALEGGGFAVAWTARAGDESTPILQIFAADGTPIGPEIALGVAGALSERAVELAAIPGGGVWAVWQRFDTVTNDWVLGGRMIDADGDPVGGPRTIATGGNDSTFDPALTVHEDGTLTVVWREALSANENIVDGADEIRGISLEPVVEGTAGRDRLDLDGTVSNLRGLAGNDRLDGGRRGDRLDGGEGGDLLVGNGGGDLLTGGSGRDTFAFVTTDADGAATITDFEFGTDQLALDDRFFGLGDGRIDARGVTEAQATNAISTGKFRYSAETGELRIDRDGRNGPAEAELIAVLEGGGRLTADDVLLF